MLFSTIVLYTYKLDVDARLECYTYLVNIIYIVY